MGGILGGMGDIAVLAKEEAARVRQIVEWKRISAD